MLGIIGKYTYSSIIDPWHSQQVNVKDLIEEEKAFEYLKKSVYKGMTLDEVLDAFQNMCQIPLGHDLILYEAGAYAFNLEPGFYLCLARQYRDSDGISKQIHVNLRCALDQENRLLRESVWNDELDEDIFSYIKRTETYNLMRSKNDFEITVFVY